MGQGDYLADAWEKEETAYIIERYVKLKATIDNWETKKKKREKHKLEREQAELDKRRAKSIQSYSDKITRIEVIARGAREQADEDRKHEESKVKEKANKIRLTGKTPATCFCF
ncbi:Remorin family protein [Striga hermonthica]|uniref:Remorin family protein n=1 Tax=Striga hermonthica TaxID=68872 RepID=A0A9N7RI39_STRHE|nr:Remorin family protein [Striga hermonthica]